MDTTQDSITISLTDTLTNNLEYTEAYASVTGDSSYTLDFGNLCPNLTISNSSWLNSNIASPGTLTVDDTMVWGNGWGRPEGKLSLRGEDADIDINGVSLMATIKEIGDRLNMLCPDPEMEAEWDQLRELREQYEAKLQECREKSRAWRALQQIG